MFGVVYGEAYLKYTFYAELRGRVGFTTRKTETKLASVRVPAQYGPRSVTSSAASRRAGSACQARDCTCSTWPRRSDS